MKSENDTMIEVLIVNANRYPDWTEQDLYKLLYQAAMGNEHAIIDEAGVRRWMEKELAEMGDGPDDLLFDPISPDGAILRVHLRPMMKAGIDPDLILQAFLNTSHVFKGSLDRLLLYMESAVEAAKKKEIDFPVISLTNYFAHMKDSGFPAVHHSLEYEKVYRPAYRVVAKNSLSTKLFA